MGTGSTSRIIMLKRRLKRKQNKARAELRNLKASRKVDPKCNQANLDNP